MKKRIDRDSIIDFTTRIKSGYLPLQTFLPRYIGKTHFHCSFVIGHPNGKKVRTKKLRFFIVERIDTTILGKLVFKGNSYYFSFDLTERKSTFEFFSKKQKVNK